MFHCNVYILVWYLFVVVFGLVVPLLLFGIFVLPFLVVFLGLWYYFNEQRKRELRVESENACSC